ncbi:hypothetical protein OF83DRAFT_453147 [Amylostereum chailletii]|nr:hypothetical protein OF83DRAFT_453147 [Amylostereum chailletii]
MDSERTNSGHTSTAHPSQGYGTTSVEDRKFAHSADKFWFMYLTDADKYDKSLAENWKGDTDGILIFTGLFAATVAAFTIESYKMLKPDSGDNTVTLLAQMSQQLAAISNGTRLPSPLPLPDSSSFRAPRYGLHINILWFTSLTLSIMCALIATLVQQWIRKYTQDVQRRGPPRKRGPVQIYLFMGMHRFKLGHAVDTVISLSHLSVFLFLSGLVVFLFSLNRTLACVVLSFISIGAVAYLSLSVLPLVFLDCPYETPLTRMLRVFGLGLLHYCSTKMRMAFQTLFHDRLPSNNRPASQRTLCTRLLRILKTTEHTVMIRYHGRGVFLRNMDRASDQNLKHAYTLYLQSADEHSEREAFLISMMAWDEQRIVGADGYRRARDHRRILCDRAILDVVISL